LNEDGLAALIEPGPIEERVFGTRDRSEIATAIEGTVSELGEVRRALFYEASTGAVAGLELAGGRRVVVKVQLMRFERVFALGAVQATLAARGFPCPKPIGAPSALGNGVARVEALLDRGGRADVRVPELRSEVAAKLFEMGELSVAPPSLGASWFSGLPRGRVWPRPHNAKLDFEATRAGAEWIDAIAARARSIGSGGGARLGHFDWRGDHFRFEGTTMVAAYDWDSVHADAEPVIAGAGAASFASRIEGGVPIEAPTLEELEGFLADFESARNRPWTRTERRSAEASCLYSLAYLARCAHASGDGPERFKVLREADSRWDLGG
jgi:hypothetical protein